LRFTVIAEGNETPGGESGGGADRSEIPQRGRRSEGDLLAERRARRAAESGEHALTLRADAAEATVRTLETHVASLQRRLRDAEEEGRRMSELIETARVARPGEHSELGGRAHAPSAESALERELQRASQREYAEQRLRIEAEDRCGELEREARSEIDNLSHRLRASEREAQELSGRLESVQRELAEAEQAAAGERAAVLRTERSLQARLVELERRAIEIQRGLEHERIERGRAERLLADMRRTHRSAQGLVGELADALAQLKGASAGASATPAPTVAEPRAPRRPVSSASASAAPDAGGGASAQAPGGEMAEALAAAVERLRARVEEQPAQPPAPAQARAPHKHSMSLITRSRIALRRRRERRKERRER
jgi:hypothetical protein